ncbi:MAG TPA: hypothetical protein VLY24_20335 [Bryobacteraceae bacterium]|nr:hypothetical protein [Bryobacteraceae bacterium]
MLRHGAAALPRAAAPALIQIKRGYRARWQDLDLSIEMDSEQWTARVQNTARTETMHTAHRGTATAARLAAAEFAIFRLSSPAAGQTPERLAKSLEWHEYWQ